MNFVVIATQRRYRVKMKNGQPFASVFLKRPVRRVFKERFETEGGGKSSRPCSKRPAPSVMCGRFPAPRSMPLWLCVI